MREKLSKVQGVLAKISEIDTNLSHLRQKQWEIDQRMNQTRENLKSLKYNKAAGDLKNKLSKTLEELSKEGEGVTKNIVSLTDERSTLAVSVDQIIGEISFGN
jgi:prefoldin subunit 5